MLLLLLLRLLLLIQGNQRESLAEARSREKQTHKIDRTKEHPAVKQAYTHKQRTPLVRGAGPSE